MSGHEERPAPERSVIRRLRRANTQLEPKALRASAQPRAVSGREEMKKVFINNGKRPDEPYNAQLGFWLPPDSPYGNLQLKLMKLCQRLDEANCRLIDSWSCWEQARTDDMLPVNAYERHVYANEQAVYLIRRAADEMIALIWCLLEWERNLS